MKRRMNDAPWRDHRLLPEFPDFHEHDFGEARRSVFATPVPLQFERELDPTDGFPASLDADGFLFITDRKKDVVFVKGFNVFPREVEEVIHTHSKVDVAGVVGVPDARTGGERLVAFVVPRAGEKIDVAEISAYCASRLVDYKCPAEVRVVKQLPLTSAQKLDRIALRRAARSEQEPSSGIR